MPRLFTGIEIPEDIAAELELMRGGIWGARWIGRENYHITLRFMGDIPEHLAQEIAHELDGIEVRPFDIMLKGMGYFGGKEPHTLYAGVEENASLRRLQAQHERICQSLGLDADPRRFTPHVTLARLRDASAAEVHNFVIGHNLFRSRPFPLSRFVLFPSRPSRGGGPYAVEEAYEMGALL
jgi:2'-5' RNA ligase